MINSKKDGKNCKGIMKNQLSNPGPSLGVAKNLWKTKPTYFLKASRSEPMSLKDYKIWLGVYY